MYRIWFSEQIDAETRAWYLLCETSDVKEAYIYANSGFIVAQNGGVFDVFELAKLASTSQQHERSAP